MIIRNFRVLTVVSIVFLFFSIYPDASKNSVFDATLKQNQANECLQIL